MADLSKYPDQSLEEVLLNPKASRKLKTQIEAELNRRSQAQGQDRTPNPVVDPITGQPTGGAPGFLANFVPSLSQFGDSLATGIANTLADPISTAAAVLPSAAEHYTQRYFTPEEGQPWYSDALNTFNSDPVGFLGDVGLVGGVARAASPRGSAMNRAGRIAERADPVTLGMGALQTGWMAGQNQWGRRPGETMGGTSYGVPRGAQRENLPEYVSTVERAIEQGFPPNLEGAQASTAARQAEGARVGEIINELEAQGRGVRRDDLVRELINLQRSRPSSAEVPYRSAVDKMVDDIMQGQDNYIGPKELQDLKETYAGLVNYDSATPSVDRLGQEGYSDASKVVRERLRANPELKEQYDRFGEARAVEDITTRGAAADLSRPPHSLDPWRLIYDNVAPLITGQSQFDRARARVAYNRGDRIQAFGRATEKTPYGVLRQGAYAADMTGEDPDKRWHVGRLWEE